MDEIEEEVDPRIGEELEDSLVCEICNRSVGVVLYCEQHGQYEHAACHRKLEEMKA